MKQIENIFSSKPSKETHKTPIIVDIHEKNSLVPSFLSKLKANYKVEHLEIADYLIGDIAIERKTFSDFLSSMINKRLTNQLIEIKKYPRYFLIIEGSRFAPTQEVDENFGLDNNSKRRRRLRVGELGGISRPKFFKSGNNYPSNLENPARGMILSIITNYEIPILFTRDEEDTANFLLLLAKKFDKPPQEFALRQSRSQLTKEQQKQFILEGFPGIGPTLAKQLLEKFKTLNNIFKASEEELKQIPKFNESKIIIFKSLLEN